MKIGIDIQDVSRIERLTPEKLQRIFSAREISYIEQKNNSPETIAGLFAAKEAYFKALGQGITHNRLLEIEIGHDKNGAPHYVEIINSTLSISHTKTTAVAVCVIYHNLV